MSKFHLLLFALLSIQTFASVPKALFYYLPIGNKVTFQADLSVGSIQSYTWDFGDDSSIITTSSSSIDHYYAYAAFWKVSLTVTDSNNRQGTAQHLVLSPQNSVPKSDFTISSVVDDQVFLNAANSRDSDGSIAQYFWDMGDGQGVWTTTSSSFTYTYILGGTYTITLKVADNSGANSTSTTKTVFVNHAPIPQFDFVVDGHQVTLNATSSQDPDGSIKYYNWNFGDQAAINGTTNINVVHQYNLSGVYQVNLTITDNLGKSASIQKSFLIDLAPKPQVVIVSNIDDDLTLNAGQTWADNNSSIVQLVWDWGDNTTTTSSDKNANVLHSYERGAVYPITLTVTDNFGVSSQIALSVLVNTVPRVDFAALEVVNDTIIVESLAQDVDGEIINYSWNFGDSSSAFASPDALAMNHTYLLGGTYNVCLTVIDNMNAQNTSCQEFFLNRVPQSQFRIAYNQDDLVVLEDAGSFDLDGTIARYIWDFGDGSSEDSEENLASAHNYTWGGFYNVSLTVVDNLNGQHTSTLEIKVNTAPTSEFIITQLGNDIVLIDASSSSDVDGNIIEYTWDLGDGTLLITQDPILQHQYSLGDTYSISLTVRDNMNATSVTRTQDIFVDIAPIADFEIIGMLDNAWVIVTAKPYLSQRSTRDLDGVISSVIWNFGDNSSNITNQTYATQMHQYTTGGNFTISLYAVDNNGVISAQRQKSILLSKPPQAAFDLTVNASGYAILDAQSSYDVDGYITSYCWNFGDGSTIQCTSSPSMTYLYNSSGDYNVSLSVTDNAGLRSSNTAQKSLFVNQAPYALFEIVDVLSSGLLTVQSSQDDSVDLDGYITQYTWSFGDNTSLVTQTNSQLSNTSQVQHLYAKSGFYNVTLQVTDNLNATSSVTIPILVLVNDAEEDVSQEFDPSSDNYLKVTNQTIPSFPTNSAPAAKILSWIEGYTVYLSAQASSDADGFIAKFFWDLGDAATTSTEKLLSYTYPRGGPYNVSLTVTDNLGKNSTTFQIINLNYVPQAFFNFQIINNVTLQLDASQCFDVDGNITSYQWDFGDGKSLVKTDGKAFTHTFKSTGIYAVKLVVKDNMGAENTFVLNLNMQGVPEVRRIVTGLPIKANLMNVATLQYLSFTYSLDLSTSAYLMTDSPAFSYNDTMVTQDSNLRLYRNSQNSTYYIMNANGLALDISPENQEIQVQLQTGGDTTSFLVLRNANYYQFVDPETGLYLAVSQDDASVLELISNSNSAQALWNLVVSDDTPLN